LPPDAFMLRSLLFAAAFYAITGLMLVGLSWLLLAPRYWAMAGLKLHARIATWLLHVIVGTKMEVRGRENLPEGPVLVVAKHQSTWDTFALIPLFDDPAIILKDELKWIPFYGWFCVKFEHILVKRDKAAVALKAMVADAKDRVADGRQVLIFPEGTRTAPGAPPDYKPGYLALYDALAVPCVPVALNSGLFWPRRKFMRYPGTIVVSFLPPVPPGLPRKVAKERIESALEAESRSLIAEARMDSPTAPFSNSEK
jgi:1-acyl-sn-glycerol-3-phosphate acyltransferase